MMDAVQDQSVPSYSYGAAVMAAVCGSLALLVTAGTLTDAAILYLRSDHEDPVIVMKSNTTAGSACSKDADGISRSNYKISLRDVITAFSLFKTVPTLLSTKEVPGSILSLNGLRVLSSMWIIVQHVWLWSTSSDKESFPFQVMISDYFSVDNFFFIGGVLTAYLNLQDMQKRHGHFAWLYYYSHRYLRLTPSHIFVVFFTWFLLPHLSFYTVQFSESCSIYWWTNLFYINNLCPWDVGKVCLVWTWYLSCDMQYYALSPLIIIPAYSVFSHGLGIASGVLVFVFTITATLVGLFDIRSSCFAGVLHRYHPVPSTTIIEYNNLFYTKPWGHASPYIIGLVLGCIIYKGLKLPFGRVKAAAVHVVLWMLTGVILTSSILGLFFLRNSHNTSTLEHIFYATFSRFFWALSLALMIFSCHNGYGWFVSSFLSMRLWIPLSRMTFNVFLVHPVILHGLYGGIQTTSFEYDSVSLNVGFIVFSYLMAGVLCLCVEFPFGTIEALVYKQLRFKGRTSQRQEVSVKQKVE